MTFNVTFHHFNQETIFVQLQMWLIIQNILEDIHLFAT